MPPLLFAFVVTFLGGLLVAALQASFEAKARRERHDSSRLSSQLFPQIALLRTAAFSVIGAWAAMPVFLACLLLSSITVGFSVTFVLAYLGAGIGLAFLYMALAFVLKCPSCHRYLLFQWLSKPQFGERYLGFDAWASIVLHVARRQPFCCMHCGQHFETKAG